MNITFSTEQLATLHSLMESEIESQRENVMDACRGDPEFLNLAAEAYTSCYYLMGCFYIDGTKKITTGPREIELTNEQLQFLVEITEIATDLARDEAELPDNGAYPGQFGPAPNAQEEFNELNALYSFLCAIAAAHGVEVGLALGQEPE